MSESIFQINLIYLLHLEVSITLQISNAAYRRAKSWLKHFQKKLDLYTLGDEFITSQLIMYHSPPCTNIPRWFILVLPTHFEKKLIINFNAIVVLKCCMPYACVLIALSFKWCAWTCRIPYLQNPQYSKNYYSNLQINCISNVLQVFNRFLQ